MNKRIRKIREKNRLTQNEFGEKIGISHAAISKLESGENHPSEQTIRSICREFDIDRLWLETGIGDMNYRFNAYTPSELSAILEGCFPRKRIESVIQVLLMPDDKYNAISNIIDFVSAQNEEEKRKV